MMSKEDRERLDAERYEDARWMLDNGESFERAAARLGLTRDGLKRLLGRQHAKGDTPAPT